MSRVVFLRLAWFVALTAGVHWLSIRSAPQFLMNAAMQRISARAGGDNHLIHGRRPDADLRAVVMPAPDVLYSACVYDLRHGPVRVSAEFAPGVYWSLSAYDARSDNYFVVDDLQAGAAPGSYVVVAPGQTLPDWVQLPRIHSPSTRGVLLWRALITDEAGIGELDRLRRQAVCAPFEAAAQP